VVVDDGFREVLARVPAGVVVVSTRLEPGFRGLTASSFTGVSLEPPIVLVCLDSLSATRAGVAASREFNLSLLGRSQEFAAERFAGRAPAVSPDWSEVPHRLGANGIPILEGCAAWFECELWGLQEAGDHDVALGLVTAFGTGSEEPLVHWNRGFWKLT